jgi:hypothetical protein
VKVASADPAGTVTEAVGTGRRALLLDNETTAPPVSAGVLSVTVQVVAAPPLRLVGVQVRELSIIGASRLMLAVCEIPFNVAVKVAVWLLATVPAIAVNVVDVDPAGTVTDTAGTGSKVLLLASATTVPPVGTLLLRVTVQVVAAPELKLVGVHASELNTGEAVRATVAVWETPAGTLAEA